MNLPNKLSLLRIILVPVMAVLYVVEIPLAPLWAVIVFILAACTDFLDGYIARKYHLVTDLGKLLDPIADKLLVAMALLLVAESNILPIGVGSIAAGIIIGREFLISAIRQIAAGKGIIIQANVYGKIKTICQDIALPLLMLLKMKEDLIALSSVLYDVLRYAAYVTFGVAVFMTILSCVIYLIQNKSVFRQE